MDIKATIKKRGFTMVQVAEALGITKGAFSQILSRDSVTTKNLEKIANVIGCKVGDFFTDEMSNTDFVALIKSGNEFFCASSLKDLEDIVSELKAKI